MTSHAPAPADDVTLPRATQERSRASLERVLDATVTLLVERGSTGFTIAEVGALARVAVGTIYGRAGSKESLLLAVFSRELDRIDAATASVLSGASDGGDTFVAAVRLLIEARLTILTREATLLRAIIRAADEYPTVAGRGHTSGAVAEGAFADALERICQRFDLHAAPDDIAWAGDVVEAVATRQLEIGLPDHAAPPRPIDADVFAQRITDTVTSYLLAREAC